MLGEDGQCRIYAFRPMSCRKAISIDDPEKCSKDNDEHPEMFVVPESEIVASAAMSAQESGSLAKLLYASVIEVMRSEAEPTASRSTEPAPMSPELSLD